MVGGCQVRYKQGMRVVVVMVRKERIEKRFGIVFGMHSRVSVPPQFPPSLLVS